MIPVGAVLAIHHSGCSIYNAWQNNTSEKLVVSNGICRKHDFSRIRNYHLHHYERRHQETDIPIDMIY
jgi:hypothetical protein